MKRVKVFFLSSPDCHLDSPESDFPNYQHSPDSPNFHHSPVSPNFHHSPGSTSGQPQVGPDRLLPATDLRAWEAEVKYFDKILSRDTYQ